MVSLQQSFQVVSVFVPDELNAKIIHDKCECDWLPHMLPEPWHKLTGMVSVGALSMVVTVLADTSGIILEVV